MNTTAVFVTGAGGYLGGRLSAYLQAAPQIDPVLGSRDTELLRKRYAMPTTYRTFDLALGTADSNVFMGVDCVVHLAAANEIVCQSRPDEAIEINVAGTRRALEIAIRSQVKRFIYMSTAHVYGAPLEGVLTESTVPAPASVYAITHRAAEDFVLAAHRAGDIEGIVLRLSNCIGSPLVADTDRWSLVVNALCRDVVESGSITLRSSGKQLRDFIPMASVLDAVGFMIELESQRIDDGLFNLSFGTSHSILEICEIIAGAYHKRMRVWPKIERGAGDNDGAVLSISNEKLVRLGYLGNGRIDEEIEDTLEKCFDWFG